MIYFSRQIDFYFIFLFFCE